MNDIDARIIDALKLKFNFRKVGGAWMQEGTCPDCNERSVYCAGTQPKIARCGKANSCGSEWTMRELFPDIFEDWSKRAPKTPENPNATADAYLQHERGFDLQHLRGAYSQEYFHDPDLDTGSATVRFPLGPDAWWERIIDRPGRFEKKANFKPKGKWRGHAWIPPRFTFEQLATADEIRMVEGIFDAESWASAGHFAVSCMTVNVWPEWFFEKLLEAIRNGPSPKHRPVIVWAFDVGAAGVTWTKKFVKRARKEGWESTADQVRPDGEGTKLDWNDLWLRQISSAEPAKGDDDRRPFSETMLETYRFNGKVTIAATPEEKADLLQSRNKGRTFWMRFENRLYWCKFEHDDDNGPGEFRPTPISNCAFKILYRERDENIDETNYFLQVDFPNLPGTENKRPSEKARFSSNACATSSEFKKRLMAFAGMWTGSGEQLDRIMAAMTADLKTVRPLHFTGYSALDRAWVLGDIAVREGRVVKVNAEKYFDFGKAAVKLQTSERILNINYNQDKLDTSWLKHVWTAWGPEGLLVIAFFTMSLFAVQIRTRHKSLGFLEITGIPGSGKTTLVEFAWKLLGRAEHEGIDPNKGTTAYLPRQLMKVSNLPVGLIEGKRDDKAKTHNRAYDYDDLLTLYNGRNPRGIASRTGGMETFEPPFLGSIYLMQNHRIEAMDAVLQRLMSFSIDKSRWNENTTASAQLIEAWPIEDVSGYIIHAVRKEADWLGKFFDRYQHHSGAMAARVEEAGRGRKLHESRVIKCHSQLAAAVDALQLLLKIPDKWVSETTALIDSMAFDRQQSSGADHPIVSRFWEQVEYLQGRESDVAHADGTSINQHRKTDEFFAVNLPQFESRCRNAGLIPPTHDELKRHLKSSRVRKFVDTKNVNNPANKQVHCWIFQQPAPAPKLPV